MSYRYLWSVNRRFVLNFSILVTVTIIAISGRELLGWRADALQTKPEVPVPLPVDTTVVQPEIVVAGRHYSGIVRELQKAELSFRVGGTVESLYRVREADGKEHNIHEGDTVLQGTVIAQLDVADYKRQENIAAAKLSIARAKLAQAEADAAFAASEFQRNERIVDRGGVSRSELENSRTKKLTTLANLEAARHDLQSVEISLEQSKADVSYGTLKMPFEKGTIAARYVHNGERLAANQRAFLVLDVSSVVVSFAVPDTVVVHLRLGDSLDVTTEAHAGRRFEGKIHKIGSSANEQTRTYDVEVRIDQPEGLRPGMFANVHFRRDLTARLLPLTAIVPSPGTAMFDVYVVEHRDEQTFVRKTPVKIIDVLGNRVSIDVSDESKLRDGDSVVTTGTHRLYDGQAVHLEMIPTPSASFTGKGQP